MKKVKEMSIQEIEGILEDLDWIDIHKRCVFSAYPGGTINIFTDGSVEELPQNTGYRDDSQVIGTLRAWGRGNTDTYAYLDGWGEVSEDGESFIVDDGRVLTINEAIEECIECGEWSEWIAHEKRGLVENLPMFL
jgi:hypothetical protein